MWNVKCKAKCEKWNVKCAMCNVKWSRYRRWDRGLCRWLRQTVVRHRQSLSVDTVRGSIGQSRWKVLNRRGEIASVDVYGRQMWNVKCKRWSEMWNVRWNAKCKMKCKMWNEMWNVKWKMKGEMWNVKVKWNSYSRWDRGLRRWVRQTVDHCRYSGSVDTGREASD